MSRAATAHPKCRCITETRFPGVPAGVPSAGGQPEIVVDVDRGRIPLWARGTVLHWRFEARSLARHDDPEAVRRRVRSLLRDAISAWQGAAPLRFVESDIDNDFEIALRVRKDCDEAGCTLASAFFPSSERQKLLIMPTLFEYDRREQVATMVHELGHIFGLRHYFANTDPDEKFFPSRIFGRHSSFSVMNYGPRSQITNADREDLARLYEAAWSADAEARLGIQVRLVQAPHLTR